MKLNRLLCAVALAAALPLAAQAAVSVYVNIAPPPLPVYVQPEIPGPGYLWTPGYWRWDPFAADYFWVPGTWVSPPAVGLLWTPGWWGWGNGGYFWRGGYWGSRVGFYGGVNYGYGYVGSGYQGGYWRGGVFNYNRTVNNITNTTIIHNVYNAPVAENHTRVSFNGGQGGVTARPGREDRLANAEHHFAPTSMQQRHEQVAMRTPEQRAAFNHGAPTLAAMPRPSESRGGEATHGRPMQERAVGNVPPPPRRELARGEASPAMAQHERRGDRPEAAQHGAAPVPQLQSAAPMPQQHPQQQIQPHAQPQMPAQPRPPQQAEGERPQPHTQGQPERQGQPEHRGGGKPERER